MVTPSPSPSGFDIGTVSQWTGPVVGLIIGLAAIATVLLLVRLRARE